MAASAFVGLILFAQVLMQVGNPVVIPPPQPAPQNTTVVNNNVFPTPDPEVVAESEKQAAPLILQSGLQSLDENGASSISEVFKLALQLGRIRQDMILLPVVQQINQGMQRIVLASLALVIAALAFWGLMGQFVGSDAAEALEVLARVPLWCVLALTSLQWLGLMLNFFTALGGVIATSADGAFGPTLRPDFWSDAGLGLFAVFVGLFYLLNLLLFSVQLFTNTAFLAFCALVAPVFVFLKATPWTAKWGDNWFRMVPGTAGELLAMLALLVVGGAGLNLITGSSAFATIAFDLGLLLSLPLIRRLFGLEANSVGSRLLGGFLLLRTMRALRASSHASAASSAAGAAAGAATASPTQPSRAPRWANHSYGTGVTSKPVGWPAKA